MSTPRPAMLVAIVTAALRPAGRFVPLALGCSVLGVEDHVVDPPALQLAGEHLESRRRSFPDQDRLADPDCAASISATTAFHLPSFVL